MNIFIIDDVADTFIRYKLTDATIEVLFNVDNEHDVVAFVRALDTKQQATLLGNDFQLTISANNVLQHHGAKLHCQFKLTPYAKTMLRNEMIARYSLKIK